MALSDKGFVDKINSCLNRSLSEIQNAQLADSISKISTYKIDSVATFAALPPAFENTGRMIFVVAEDTYYYSDGTSWTKDLRSSPSLTSLYSIGGSNGSCFRLGDGTTVDRCSPGLVIGGFTDWCQVSTGNFTSAVRTNGTIWSWGVNRYGNLGDGTTVDRCSPVSVVGGFTDWCQVAVAPATSAAIRRNGTLWTWGRACNGTLGDNTTVNKCSPVSVVGGFTDWCQVEAARTESHITALRRNGTAWSWGCNNAGASTIAGFLGDGTTLNRSSPVSVVGGITDWCRIAVGIRFVLGLRCDGSMASWGFNCAGQLGSFNTIQRCSPGAVDAGSTGWTSVGASTYTAFALKCDGRLYSWGCGNNGVLGDGTTTNRCLPGLVSGGFTDWCAIGQSRAIRTDGSLWSWGCNNSGQLGDGTTVNKSSPVSVIGNFETWCQVDGCFAILVTKGF